VKRYLHMKVKKCGKEEDQLTMSDFFVRFTSLYVYVSREEGNLKALRQVQQEHKEKTKHMDDAIKTAKEIYQDQVKANGDEL
jgi:hypothetical protein